MENTQAVDIIISLVILLSILSLFLCIVYYHFGRDRHRNQLLLDNEYLLQP